MNYRLIFRVIGLLCVLEAIAMLLSCAVAWLTDGRDLKAFALSAGAGLFVGIPLLYKTSGMKEVVSRREGFLIVSLVWVIVSVLGALPYVISGEIPGFIDAFFESVSGFTTTGATVIANIESQSKGMLFWRALTQWLGGIGIIMLTLSFLRSFGIGGMQLFEAEVTGPVHDRVNSRIHQTARNIWGIYILLTLAETILLKAGGMTFFDSICHSLSTMASSGFSTKQAGLAFWPSPFIHYVVIFFMIIAGTNFSLTYLLFRGHFSRFCRNEEFKYYILFILIFTLAIFTGLLFTSEQPALLSFRESFFTVVSVITTTGYGNIDFTKWAPFLVLIIFALYFFGGMTGSTGGGMKIMRIIILLKNSYYELKRIVYPKAMIEVRLNKKIVDQKIISKILAFFMFYILIFCLASALLMIVLPDFETCIGAVAASMANIGPGLGDVGPSFTYAHIHDSGKILLALLMVLGRLELLTVLVVFTPSFWRD